MNTVVRTIRVPDDLWKAAQAEAERRGETVSDVVRRALRRYASAGRPMGDVWREDGCDPDGMYPVVGPGWANPPVYCVSKDVAAQVADALNRSQT